jgi:hypothetical protein
LELRKITREIIQQVEDVSGFPVQVTQDLKIQTMAAARIARGRTPFHVIVYKPYTGEQPDYAICYQCGFIIRKFSVPQEARMDLAPAETGQQEVDQLLLSPNGIAFKYGLKGPAVTQLRDQLLNGLIVHLLSIPVGMRVSAWIGENYPDLVELEKKHVEKELAIIKESMADNIKAVFPTQIFRSSQTISGAYALYWSQKYNNPKIFAPFRFDFRKSCEELLDIFQDLPVGPQFDRDLINAWGAKLGFQNWYQWVPYQQPA